MHYLPFVCELRKGHPSLGVVVSIDQILCHVVTDIKQPNVRSSATILHFLQFCDSVLQSDYGDGIFHIFGVEQIDWQSFSHDRMDVTLSNTWLDVSITCSITSNFDGVPLLILLRLWILDDYLAQQNHNDRQLMQTTSNLP